MTNNNPGAFLLVNDDGNAVVYSPSNTVLWSKAGAGSSSSVDRLYAYSLP